MVGSKATKLVVARKALVIALATSKQPHIPNAIIVVFGNINVSQILINGGSSCDIKYLVLFKKMDLDQSNLLLYEGSNL